MEKKKRVGRVPTQDEALAAKEATAAQEALKKSAMKRQGAKVRGKGRPGGTDCIATIGPITTEPETKGASNRVGKQKENRPKKAPVPQGRRKVPTAGDEHGCKHRGLRELDPCNKRWIASYVKTGAWLYNKSCVDCTAKSKGDKKGEDGLVLDAAVLLHVKDSNVAFICNCGPIGHKMMEGEEGRDDYQCDLMLCVPCYSDRESKMDQDGGSKRKRRRKTAV